MGIVVQNLRNTIHENKIFLLPYLVLLLGLLPVFLLIPKTEIHLNLNHYHYQSTDFCFSYLTWLGDGFIPIIIGFIYLLFSFRKGIKVLAAGLMAGLFVQFLKHLVFPGVQRPYAIFKDNPAFYSIEGYKLYSSFSFPSGHAATIFALCFVIAIFSKNHIVKLLLLLIAIIVAFSRVYLSQHFLIDIYIGSIIGVLTALFTDSAFETMNSNWLDKGLIIRNRKS